MTLREIITLVQYHIGDDVSRSLIRQVLDQRVKELYNFTGYQLRKFDPATGQHPFLATTTGTRIYDYPDDVEKILLLYDAEWSIPEYDYYPFYPTTADDTNRKITFAEDPETTTTKYRIISTFKPTDITLEIDSQLVVPLSKRFPLLVVGCVAGLQPDHKRYTEPFWEELKIDFWDKVFRTGAKPLRETVAYKTEFAEGDVSPVTDYRSRRLTGG